MPRFRVLVLTLCTLLSCLAVIAAISGCDTIRNEWYKQPLQRVLLENSFIGDIPARARATAMHKVNLSGCPGDFISAYNQYIHAWEEVASAEDESIRLQGQTGAVIGASIEAWLSNSAQTPLKDHSDAMSQASSHVNDAHTDVAKARQSFEDVTRKYGLQP
ncbi:hypothetical protein [Terracidiphilus gabretensis]|uniref:hypothetical protein n=1 Tax=Terracidiphilus gabretensis TaxID=1577687 RepID=UPI00071B810E|nr:hypothetical protein [Terracidiphilus gabretensis]